MNKNLMIPTHPNEEGHTLQPQKVTKIFSQNHFFRISISDHSNSDEKSIKRQDFPEKSATRERLKSQPDCNQRKSSCETKPEKLSSSKQKKEYRRHQSMCAGTIF